MGSREAVCYLFSFLGFDGLQPKKNTALRCSNLYIRGKFNKMSMKGRFDLLPDFFKLTLVFSFYLTMYLVSALVSAGVCQLIYGVNFFDSGAQSFDLSNPTNLAAIKLFQLISSLIVFIGTTGIATYFIAKQPLQFLGLTKMPIALTIILAMATMLLITPFINYTFAMNSMLDLPDWMSSLEKEASGFTEAFLKMKGPGDLIYNLLIIALIPAIGEEVICLCGAARCGCR